MQSSMGTPRSASFKLPPSTVSDQTLTQDQRRARALQEQRRRRAKQFDASRQLDRFANLNLNEDSSSDEQEDAKQRGVDGVSAYASLLSSAAPNAQAEAATFSSSAQHPPEEPRCAPEQSSASDPQKKKKRRRKRKKNQWADTCMYAELLELREPSPFYGNEDEDGGLPSDLGEDGTWIALAPVPRGKRCMAVVGGKGSSNAHSGQPQAHLYSRLRAHPLLPAFPTTLPPRTVLDCILDADWKVTGTVWVLDCLCWGGVSVEGAEGGMRFWWRDTRLAETPAPPLPPSASPHILPTNTYTFPYPTSLRPIPAHSDTSLPVLLSTIIPAAKAAHAYTVSTPLSYSFDFGNGTAEGDGGMELDAPPALGQVVTKEMHAQTDGLLLYVAGAAYEPGPSPLSAWVPATPVDQVQGEGGVRTVDKSEGEAPLQLFERLVKRKLEKQLHGQAQTPRPVDVEMEL